jgi:hypothetical protein
MRSRVCHESQRDVLVVLAVLVVAVGGGGGEERAMRRWWLGEGVGLYWEVGGWGRACEEGQETKGREDGSI